MLMATVRLLMSKLDDAARRDAALTVKTEKGYWDAPSGATRAEVRALDQVAHYAAQALAYIEAGSPPPVPSFVDSLRVALKRYGHPRDWPWRTVPPLQSEAEKPR
jgi:hypothetical protein